MIYDILIIGGGMSGISVAHFFRNQKTLILEKGNLLQGATGNNAGFLISGFGEHYNKTASRWGRARAREIQQIHQENHRRIHDLTTELDCSHERSGSYIVALSENEKEDLVLSEKWMKEDGMDVSWVDSAPVGLNRSYGALFQANDGWLQAREFWERLAQGIPIRTGCEVLSVESDGEQICVRTAVGDFHAHRVIYCLNAFAAGVVPELAGRYIPLRGQLMEMPAQGSLPGSPVIAEYGEIYWRFSGSSLIFGGLEYLVPEEEVGAATHLSLKLEEFQRNWIRTNLDPDLLSVDISHAASRYSTMAFTVDGFPFVGELGRKNHYVLSGLCGLGHSYSLELASWLYRSIVEGVDVIPPCFSASRLPQLPKYSGGTWRNLYEAWNHGTH